MLNRYMRNMKYWLVMILYLLPLCGEAQDNQIFSQISWDKDVSSLPYFTKSVDLGEDYFMYSYSAHLEYPEYVKLTDTETNLLKRHNFHPTDSIVVETQIGVSRKQGILEIGFVPVIKKNNNLYRLTSCKVVVDKHTKLRAPMKNIKGADRYKSHSVLSKGKWAKIRVKEEGVYSLTQSFVSSLGFSNLSKVKVYGYGGRVQNNIINYENVVDGDYDDLEEVPLYRRNNDVIFYAEGTRRWSDLSLSSSNAAFTATHQNNPYSSYSYYFITEGDSVLQIEDEQMNALSSDSMITSVPCHALVDNDEYSWYTSGNNLFESYNFGERGNSRDYTLVTSNVDSTKSGGIFLAFTMASKSRSSVTLNHNGKSLGTLSFSPITDEYDHAFLGTRYFTTNGLKSRNTINLKTTQRVDARLDYIRLDYFKKLVFSGNSMVFRHYSDESSNFVLSGVSDNVKVWRIGYPGHPLANVTGKYSNSQFTCLVDNPSLRYVAVDVSASFATPEKVGIIENQDLHADTICDMVIIIPESGKLQQQAQRLADYHKEKDGLRVKIVRADELYNEYSSGTPDVGAYRRYLKMLYDKADKDEDRPRYLLLFGGSVWDNRMLTPECKYLDAKDYLLCYESESSLNGISSYVTDDYFGLLDDGEGGSILSEKIDLGIGRIPAVTSNDAKIVVDKLINYMDNKNAGAWRNMVYMVADDGDNNTHMQETERVAQSLEKDFPKMAVKRIYSDAYNRISTSVGHTYPDVSAALKKILNKSGALIVNYTGHGSPILFSHEQILTLADFKNAQSDQVPMWVTASCEMTPFDMLQETIGETALFNKNSAAIAFYSSCRAVYSAQNSYLNSYFMKYVFATKSNGKRYTIGDAAMATKVSLVTPSKDAPQDYSFNKLKYALMGDPAMVLAMPLHTVVVDEINGVNVAQKADLPLLSAGSVVKVKGHIESADGEKIPSFNGTVGISLMDSKDTITCLNNANDDVGPFSYSEYTKTLYEGSDSVRNGMFETEIPIPLDIKYTNLQGRMNLYALNNAKNLEANGVCYDFLIGGNATSIENTGNGPSIYVYLNEPDFQDGGDVNETPYFYAVLNDSDGINATGNGIGHDIELIIDGKENLTYNLNNYYVSDFGSFKSGSVSFLIPRLEEGKHNLIFRAWDTKNNSSARALSFNVVDGLTPSLLKASVSKNPAFRSTKFLISYDRPESEVKFTISVYDSMGYLWWKHEETGSSSNGYYTIDWDLTSNSGVHLPSGLYLYKVGISSGNGKETTKSQKLIIHRQ